MTPGSDEMVLVISQPGRVRRVTAGQGDLHDGRLAARGAHIAPNLSGHADAMDLAPTILYALGVPASQDVTGKPILDLFTRAFVERYPVRYVSTYGPPSATSARRSGQPLDQETIDRLRSLGYVK
jgi:arylsulfatase A-like enzyme